MDINFATWQAGPACALLSHWVKNQLYPPPLSVQCAIMAVTQKMQTGHTLNTLTCHVEQKQATTYKRQYAPYAMQSQGFAGALEGSRMHKHNNTHSSELSIAQQQRPDHKYIMGKTEITFRARQSTGCWFVQI